MTTGEAGCVYLVDVVVLSYISEQPRQYLPLELNRLPLAVRPTGSTLEKILPALHVKKKKIII